MTVLSVHLFSQKYFMQRRGLQKILLREEILPFLVMEAEITYSFWRHLIPRKWGHC